MGGRQLIVLLAVSILLFIPASLALEPSFVISNSEDWRDVYSSMQYASFKGSDSAFLVGTRHGTLLLNDIGKSNIIQIISSKKSPFVLGYDSLVKGAGFSQAEELILDNPNFDLFSRLPDLKNIIIVSPAYGYNAIAVAPYAAITRSWVFFADRTNIDEVDAIISERGASKIIIYGLVDREVKATLSRHGPEIISSGDRFLDDVEIVKKYVALRPETQQVVLTNGEFIEKELMAGSEPVLFTGKENVPDQIATYLKSSPISVGVLVGSDLVGAATNIRRTTGISVIVKFARGARVPAGSISAVEGLDIFPLPIPYLNLSIHSIKYNRAASQLEVTYHSSATTSVYFKGTITPVTTGERRRLGDLEPLFIAPNDYRTVSYPDVTLDTGNLSADVFTLFGETPNALERILEGRFTIQEVNVLDGCNIDADSIKVSYNNLKKVFHISVKNSGPVNCWIDAELIDVVIDGRKQTFGSEGAIPLKKGKRGTISIPQELTSEDIDANPLVSLTLYYGEREDGLVKTLKGKFALTIERLSTGMLVVLALILIVLIILFFLFFYRRRRDRDDEL